jgi:hypothetical protein
MHWPSRRRRRCHPSNGRKRSLPAPRPTAAVPADAGGDKHVGSKNYDRCRIQQQVLAKKDAAGVVNRGGHAAMIAPTPNIEMRTTSEGFLFKLDLLNDRRLLAGCHRRR